MNSWSLIEQRTRSEHDRYRAALAEPERSQRAQLLAILERNRRCAFGRLYRFDTITEPDEYRGRVPIHDYADLEPMTHAADAGEHGSLVSEPVLLFERTSGSARAAKLIPYTQSALDAFCRALHPWLHDLATHWPGLINGRSYFSISPATRNVCRTSAGVPIGIDNDALYFGADLLAPLNGVMAVPSSLASVTDMEDWRFLTLRCLLDADDLTLISVWSPTFLTTLLGGLDSYAERLVDQVETGAALGPNGSTLDTQFEARPKRAAQVRAALSGPTVDTQSLWPALTLISCWMDGTAARFVPGLRRCLPRVALQGKGLLATEGVVSLPLTEYDYPVLAVNSGFFEFIDNMGQSRLAHEVTENEVYEVLLTTYGGLYRYRIGDQVRVCGFAEATPLLEFIGRATKVSDLCGEKISEALVQKSLAEHSGFALVAPSLSGGPGYRLVLDACEYDASAAERLAVRVEQGLRSNPHYLYARRIGQLEPVKAERHPDALTRYLGWLAHQGQRLGDIKPPVLHRELDWQHIFEVV